MAANLDYFDQKELELIEVSKLSEEEQVKYWQEHLITESEQADIIEWLEDFQLTEQERKDLSPEDQDWLREHAKNAADAIRKDNIERNRWS